MALTAPTKFFLALTGLILLHGCKEPPATPPPPPPEVVVQVVRARDIPISHEFVGKTVSSRKVEIRSRVEGFLEKRLYTEGEWVQAGQPLFQMDAKPFQAQLDASRAELAQQQARYATAKAELDRVRPLAEKNAVAQKELDNASGNFRSAAAAVEVAKANVVQAELSLGYTRITSPVTGLSSFAIQQEGAYIGLGTNSLLTYVAQIDPIWVEFSVSENQQLQFRQREESGLVMLADEREHGVDIVLADGSKYPHQGKLTFADASLSDRTGTFLVRATMPNPEHLLRPGQFVRAIIKGSVRPNAITLPKRAVQQGPTGSFVWVINDRNQSEARPVTPGPWRGSDWFIDDGLEDGDRVVIEGAARLREDAAVKVVDIRQQ